MMRLGTASVYLFCVVAMLLLALYSRRRPQTVAPLGELVDRIMITRTTRVAIALCWWWLGWHFLVGPTI